MEYDQIWLCPSRGRPGNVAQLRRDWARLTGPGAELLVAVDADDPHLDAYRAGGHVVICQPRGLGAIINTLAVPLAGGCRFVGFLGDDHRPRTRDWNRKLQNALQGRPGVAYGDDLLRGEEAPTAALVSAELIAALGYMAPPGVEHLCHDVFWKVLGSVTTLAYCPDVVIEHMHPSLEKAEWDEGYERANCKPAFDRDWADYNRFMAEAWPGDLERLLKHLQEAS